MKTLMLWACENKPSSFWSKNSITISVTELLSELIEWLIDGRCQNYFIPSKNMFEYPMGDIDLTVQILSSFVCNESQIGEITAEWSYAIPEAYFLFDLSEKLSLLFQLGLNHVSHLLNPIEPKSNDRFKLDELAAGGSELHQLVAGLIANHQAAVFKVEHKTDSNGGLARMARIHLDQSMRTIPHTDSPKKFY